METYEKALGQKLNTEYETYLGLPMVVVKNKKASLNFIKDRVWGKLQGWKGKIVVRSGEGSFVESSGASNSNVCHELFQITSRPLSRH